MGEEGYLHIIGVGSTEDWDAGRGSIYYIQDEVSGFVGLRRSQLPRARHSRTL